MIEISHRCHALKVSTEIENIIGREISVRDIRGGKTYGILEAINGDYPNYNIYLRTERKGVIEHYSCERGGFRKR